MPYEWFGIEAVDVLFFRDGRAFEAGEEHIAQSQFPPNARTVLGALRGVSFRQVCENLRQYIANGPESDWLTELNTRIGRPDTLGPASILGPFIAEWNEGDGTDSELYFAPPADLVTYVTGITDHDGTARMQYARLSPLSDIPRGVAGTSCGLTPLWLRKTRIDGGLDREKTVVSRCGLERMLGTAPLCDLPTKGHRCPVRGLEGLVAQDRRAGNALEGKQTRTGYLYEADFARPLGQAGRRAGLVFAVSGLDARSPLRMMQLGGESKWASLSSVSSGQESMLPSVQPPSRSAEETRFKVYLATPTILAAGWRPDWLQLANGAYSGHYLGDGPPVTLVSVALPTPSALGGYNVAANASRGSETAVPAGAVYFFKCSAPPDEIATLHGRRFRDCDDSHNACQLGLGLSFLGGWDYA